MQAKAPLLEPERANIAFFETLPVNDRARVDFANVRGVQFLRAAVRVLRRLRRLRRDAVSQAAVAAVRRPPADRQRDRLLVDLRRQPAGDAVDDQNAKGRGPAWSNSLFEDNAEFGLGFRLAADKHLELAQRCSRELRRRLGAELVDAILTAPQVQRVRASARSARASPS